MDNPEKKDPTDKTLSDERRRDFLRKSVYAAYATPVIISMLVAKNSAANNGNHYGQIKNDVGQPKNYEITDPTQ